MTISVVPGPFNRPVVDRRGTRALSSHRQFASFVSAGRRRFRAVSDGAEKTIAVIDLTAPPGACFVLGVKRYANRHAYRSDG